MCSHSHCDTTCKAFIERTRPLLSAQQFFGGGGSAVLLLREVSSATLIHMDGCNSMVFSVIQTHRNMLLGVLRAVGLPSEDLSNLIIRFE